jgi:AsmA-like protein
VRILPNRGGRRVTASADDAGELLRGLDYLRSMQGGKLSVQAEYDDAQPGRPLSGTANIENFRVRDAPALGRLLQAMTLYGLVELVQGPGLGFTRLIAPFRLTDDALDLTDARAFSSSLGLTAKGRANLDVQQLDMQGTIVPAYFFNSLLGNVPLVGKLFSPERGGGLFAASYTVRGPIEDPQVSVNPLTALTPGFLRGLFGIF